MNFGRKDDSLFWDVLTALALSVNMRLRWREIRDNVHKRHEKIYDKETFEVILNRVLKRLLQMGYIRRDSRGHQEVFYFVPKQRQRKIVDELNRRYAHKKLDEVWERLSSEQRKRAVETLVRQSSLIIQSEKLLVKNLTAAFRDWIPDLISGVESPSEVVRKEYSPEEKQRIIGELGSLEKQFTKIETEMAEEDKFWREKLEHLVQLAVEFTNKVVDPFYNGRFNEAIEDLMRKAIEEQNKRNNALKKTEK